MQITNLEKIPAVKCVLPPPPDAHEVTAAFTSDLLSDVMGHSPADSVLITIQAHATTVAVSIVADIRAILICSSRPIPEDMIAAARKEGIALYVTELDQYHASLAIAPLLGDLPA